MIWDHGEAAAAIHTAESCRPFIDPGCRFLFERMFGFITLSGPLAAELEMGAPSEV